MCKLTTIFTLFQMYAYFNALFDIIDGIWINILNVNSIIWISFNSRKNIFKCNIILTFCRYSLNIALFSNIHRRTERILCY